VSRGEDAVRSRALRLLVLVVALGMVGAACSKKSGSAGGGTITINGESANNHGTKDFSGKTSADVAIGNYYFDPTVIKGSAGQTLQITFKNGTSTLHNFTLAGKDMGDVQPANDARFSVTFPQSGIIEFHCKYHQSNGMVGELSA
jgi:plastocyanin